MHVYKAFASRVRTLPAAGRALAVGLLLAVALPLQAQTYGTGGSFDFSVTEQSMWGTDGPSVINFNHFLGTDWDVSGSIGGIAGSQNTVIVPGGCIIWCWDAVTADTRTGGIMTGSTSGRVGVDIGARINPGIVDIDYGLDAQITTSDMSQVGAGDLFSMGSTYGIQNDAQIDTEFASFEAWMDLQFQVQASASTTLCFVGHCDSWGGSLFNVDVTQELLSLNRNGNGSLQILGQDAPINFGDPVSIGPVDVTLSLPNLTTTGGLDGETLESSGGTDILKVGVDVPRTVLDYAFPGAGCILSCGVAGFGYSVFSSSLGPVLGLAQDFAFAATPMTTLVFDQAIQRVENGVAQAAQTEWTMALGDAMDFIFPEGIGQSLGVTPYYWLDNELTVATDITVALDLEMSALELFSPLGSIGPLYEDSFRTDNLAINVDSREFAVDFGQMQGDQFYVQSVVPEPISMILLGSGLVGVGAASRRRRKLGLESELDA